MVTQLTSLLTSECANLESEAETLREQIETARNRLRDVESRIVHVRALLGQNADANVQDEGRSLHLEGSNSLGVSVCDIAVEVLKERGRTPMYYKDLAEEVIRRGGVLNGKTPEATLTARLVRDERFVRPTSKGYYALRDDYPNARNVGARKRRVTPITKPMPEART